MNLNEALDALAKGKKLRSVWPEGMYIHIVDGCIKDEKGISACHVLNKNRYWEVYEEPAHKVTYYRRKWVRGDNRITTNCAYFLTKEQFDNYYESNNSTGSLDWETIEV